MTANIAAPFVLHGDEFHIAAWEVTLPLPPLNERDHVDTELFGMPVTVRRGYEWTEFQDGEIVSGPMAGIALGFGNGWFVVLDGVTVADGWARGCGRIPAVGACRADAHGGPSMWFRRADTHFVMDADALLAFVREVMGRQDGHE